MTGRLAQRASRSTAIVDWLTPTKVAPHARARRARHARRRHADRRPDASTRTASVALGVGGVAGAARRHRGRHDALRARRAASRCASSWRRSAPCVARRRRRAGRHARGGPGDRARRRGGAGERATGETVRSTVEPRLALMRPSSSRSARSGCRWPRRSRAPGHEVVGCDVDARVVELVNAGRGAVPRRGRADGGAGGDRRRRAPARDDRHGGRGRRGRRPRRRRAAAGGRRRRAARTGAILDAVVADIGAAALQARARRVVDRDDRPGRHDARARRPRAGGRSGLRDGRDFHVVFSPERVFSGRVFADLDTLPQARRRPQRRRARRAASSCTRAFTRRRGRGRWARAEAAELTKLAETTYRDVNIAFANELARYADDARHRRRSRVIDAANSPALQPHPPARASPSAATASRSIRASTWPATPTRACPRAAREVNEAMPAYAVELLGGRSAG